MTPLTITPDLDAAPWTELQSDIPTVGLLTHIGLLRLGTDQGRATVALVITMPDGTQALGQTTWRLLHSAVNVLKQGPVGLEEVMDL